MENAIGKGTYKITFPNGSTETFSGTADRLWDYVEHKMEGQQGVPDIQEIRATPVAVPARPALTVVSSTPAPSTHSASVALGVDVDGAARSTTDLMAAQAAGFAPAQPYYDRGTRVIDLGVQNARQSAREHEAKPRVDQAVATFVDAIKRENRRDIILPASQLAMRSDGSIVGQNGDRWLLEQSATSQLAKHVGIDKPAFLQDVWPHLRAQVWNQHVATTLGLQQSTCPVDHPVRERLMARAHKEITVRLRDTHEGQSAIWAALSERYASYDVDRIAQALEKGLSGHPDARCEIEYNGTSAKFDVLFHTDVQPERFVAGEFFKVGLRVRTSDTGGGSIIVSILVWQNLCLNLLCIDVAQFQIDRIQHKGSSQRLEDRFADAVRGGLSKLDHFLRAWGYATDEALCSKASSGVYRPEHLRVLDSMDTETVTENELLTGIFAGLGKSGQVSIGRQDIPGLLAAHAKDHSGATQVAPVTRASIVNAITRYAHEGVGLRSPLKQMDLEREAGALLVSSRGKTPAKLPYLPSHKLAAR